MGRGNEQDGEGDPTAESQPLMLYRQSDARQHDYRKIAITLIQPRPTG